MSLIEGQVLDSPDVDFSIIGDGEIPFYELVQTLDEEKEDFNNVPGLVFGQDGMHKVNPKLVIDNLDNIPYPDYRIAKINSIDNYPIITKGGWKFRSVENIVGEINF